MSYNWYDNSYSFVFTCIFVSLHVISLFSLLGNTVVWRTQRWGYRALGTQIEIKWSWLQLELVTRTFWGRRQDMETESLCPAGLEMSSFPTSAVGAELLSWLSTLPSSQPSPNWSLLHLVCIYQPNPSPPTPINEPQTQPLCQTLGPLSASKSFLYHLVNTCPFCLSPKSLHLNLDGHNAATKQRRKLAAHNLTSSYLFFPVISCH